MKLIGVLNTVQGPDRHNGRMIAITGGPAVGKSVVLRFLNEQGLRTESADDIVRDLWGNPEIASQVYELLDLPPGAPRSMVREKVMADEESRRALNALFHAPVVRRLLDSRPDAVEIPLLVETVIHPVFDDVWVLVCDPEVQLQRLCERGLDEDSARRLVDAHLNPAVKSTFATAILRTDQHLDAVYQRILELLDGRHQAR